MNKNKSYFAEYFIYITAISILMTNYDIFISYNSETSLFVLFLSIPIYFLFHGFYYKLFDNLFDIKTKNPNKGILISSRYGSILMVLLSIFNFSYDNLYKPDLERTNFMININLFFIAFICVICSIVCVFSDKNTSKIKIVTQTIIFYFILLIFSQILFGFLALLTGAFA